MVFSFGLIGYPIQHSLSPWIHEQFLKRTNHKGVYNIFEIAPADSFEEEMSKLRQKELDGFNVTVPYKEKIIEYLDEIDPYAEKIGAVNTVKCKNGKWIGYNTDGIGYVRSLESKYPEIQSDKDRTILMLGAGGAAKGIYHALTDKDYTSITIANRTKEKAQLLTEQHPSNEAISLEEAAQKINTFDIIIQTTSIGMKPNTEEVIVDFNALKQGAIVSDIVYQPIVTKFLQQAKAMNASIHLGHTMLLYQALYAFEIWTNLEPNMEYLDDELQHVLEG